LAAAIGATACLVGASVTVGWCVRLPGIHLIDPALGTMGAHSAVAFAGTGASLLLLNADGRRGARPTVGRALAAVVLLIGLGTVGVRLGWSVPADRSLIQAVQAMLPGPMPMASALTFVLLALALLLIDLPARRVAAAEILALAALLIPLLALISYTFGTLLNLGIAPPRALAFHSVALFLGLASGVLIARPHRGLMALATHSGGAGTLVRRLLPAALGLPVLIGALVALGERMAIIPGALALSYYAVSIVVLLSAVILRTAMLLDRGEQLRARAEEDVRRMNAELERRVAERTRELESVNQELEAFSYSVSHDLRAPVRHVLGFSELLSEQSGPHLDEQGRKYLGTITSSAKRMGRLIDDLLSFSRMSRTGLRKQRVDLADVVQDAKVEVMAQAHVDGRRIDWTVGALPEVHADRAMLHLAMVNLLSNAVKYTSGRPIAVIEVGTTDGAEDQVVVFVRDNGAGFDMRYADKLFGVFQRLHSSAEFEGTGIGLANVKRILTRHGGRVWAQSQVEAGATFFFSLPRS
jgi:signal transduction histidine kinase